MFQITGAFAEFEWGMTRQGINAGLRRGVIGANSLAAPGYLLRSKANTGLIASQEGHALALSTA
jgi:hypothetical protein